MRILRRLVVAFALVAVPLALPQAVRAATCPAQQYILLVMQADAAVSAAAPQPAAAAARLTAAEAAFPNATELLQPIVIDLQLNPPALDAARSLLNPLARVLALPAGATCDIDSSSAISTLHSVYASPVFANLDQNPQPSLLQRIGDLVNGVVSRLLQALGAGGSIALGLVVLAAIVALGTWRVRNSLGSRTARVIAEPPEAGDDPDAEWAAARRAAQSGDYREAVRRAFRGALLETVTRGRMQGNAAWTTRELLGAARGDAGLLAALAAAADSFDRAWYSGRSVSAQDWEHAQARCEALRALARRAAPELST